MGLIPVLISAHIFYLKYFEELELILRFGKSYIEYKKRVPFLIPQIRGSGRKKYVNDSKWFILTFCFKGPSGPTPFSTPEQRVTVAPS